MVNSDFWRELAISFKSVPDFYEFTAYRHYYGELHYFLPTSIVEPEWKFPLAIPPALAEFRAMATRGATMLPPLPTGDLAVRWLEALWKEATEGPVRSGIPILGKDRTGKLTELRGTIPRAFEASSSLCRKFESEELQAEFEEKQRNEPRDWSAFRHRVKAQETVSKAQPEPEPAKPTTKPDAATASTPKPTDTVAAQIKRLRDECRWTNEELAEETHFSSRQVSRHISGDSVPYKRNIAVYERVFSKELKKKVVINQMS
jgi:hypothetical protein